MLKTMIDRLPHLAPIILTIYAPIIYAAQYVMVFMQANAFTRASGKVMDPGNQEFFRPCEMATSR